MSTPPDKKPFPVLAVALVIAAVIALAIVFVTLASIGDDVPTKLPPATETSPGN